VLCASNGGSPKHPGWYHNLCATGRAEIQVGAEHLAVGARTADPTERSRLFPRFVEMYQGYAGYERKTSRQIPLVLLTPRAPAERDLRVAGWSGEPETPHE
jgi:deazaflavin-dependent oxidoreductase (nitroreductase family)